MYLPLVKQLNRSNRQLIDRWSVYILELLISDAIGPPKVQPTPLFIQEIEFSATL